MHEEEKDWLIIRTFWRREPDVCAFLKEKGIKHFIPMTYRERPAADGEKPKRVLVPVVHNYIFIEKAAPTRELIRVLSECPVPAHLMKSRDTDAPYEIPNRDMLEFRLLCDPDFNPSFAMQNQPDDTAVGKEVIIVHGQFAGIRGRLVRKQHKYWFVKTVAGISVMLRITRWFCKPVEE